jgi:hypothetical protein
MKRNFFVPAMRSKRYAIRNTQYAIYNIRKIASFSSISVLQLPWHERAP